MQNHKLNANSKELGGKTLLYSDEISLKYDKTTISIDVSLINYLFPQRSVFRWKLVDYDADWNLSRKNQSSINYTNLPPGNYMLIVQSSSDNLNWTDEPCLLSIIIVPPWWNTLWFKISIVFIFLLSIFTFYTVRINYLKKQRKYLNAQVDEKTEELKTLNESLEESNAEINAQNDELIRYRNHLETIVLERTSELKKALKKI